MITIGLQPRRAITIGLQPRPQSQPDQELLEGLTNLEFQEGLLVSVSRGGMCPLSQPNQELLEGLANLEFQEGLLGAVSGRHHSR